MLGGAVEPAAAGGGGGGGGGGRRRRNRRNKKGKGHVREAGAPRRGRCPAYLAAAVDQSLLLAQHMLRELHELPRKCEQEDDERQGEFTRAARGTKFNAVAYLLLRPTMRIGRTTLRDLINAGDKTCNGLHTEILRGEQVEHMMALLDERGDHLDGRQRF